MRQPRSTKGKVILGYLLLFVIAAVSVWFVYSEILKIALPEKDINAENKKILQVSNAIANLYAAETVGRNSILTGSSKDFDAYNKILDSVNLQIEAIKKQSDAAQLGKLDTIQDLLRRKRHSINEIILFRNYYNEKNTFDRAVGQITKVKDSLNRRVKPIQFKNNTQMRQFLNAVLTKRQMDSLSKLPVSNEQLTSAIEKMLTQVIIRDNRMKYELFKKEQKLQDENRIISDQLRVVLSSLEKEILQKSYAKINKSKTAINNTIETIAWIGAATFLLLIVFAAIILRDLTRNQQYRQQLETLNDEKEDLLRSKTMLLATVTHDLQTPLGSVIGFSDLLKKTEISSKQEQYIDSIKHSSHYILKLVNDLLDFSKLENNKIAIEKVSFNFKDLIENICKPLEQNATGKNIELRCDVEEELNANFISDPYRIKQILTNLVSNAIKFTQEGSVEVVAKIVRNDIVISVIDTGIGIAKNEQDAVFKEFTQAHAGIEKKFGGTGLGLTIAQRMLQLLGGTISLESEEGQGSIFTVVLPAVKSESSYKNDQPMPSVDTGFLENKKILIVDDDAMQLSLMKEVFANYPPEVTLLNDASKVKDLLESAPFDLILSDIQMPKIDGFELVRIIRNNNNPEIAHIPVIALSGKRDLNPEDFLSKGFTTFHPKPLQLEELLLQMKAIFRNEKPEFRQRAKHKSGGKLFDLTSLNQFTQNDPNALRMIIDNFIDSAKQNCQILKVAVAEMDADQMADIAHKMIPMFRQMEVWSISELLEPIEDRTLDFDKEQMQHYADDICERIENLSVKLKLEVQ
ncbi:ATP-binding protein [Flavobacterium sp.]|uniref:ATP-binding protein n=1 Tax=Flavobacterium sp. TaxID=239 RepID=UPI0039E44FBD